MKKISLALAVVFGVNLLFSVPISSVSATNFGLKAEASKQPINLRQVIEDHDQQENADDLKRYENIKTEIKEKGVNMILQTELSLLEKKLISVGDSQRSRLTSNLRKDLSGGFDYGSMNNELEILTGVKAMDESLQIGSIGEDRNRQRQLENLNNEVKKAIQNYQLDKGYLPDSLEDFGTETERWANVWWNGENQNVSEFADIFDYQNNSSEVEVKEEVKTFYRIVLEEERNNSIYIRVGNDLPELKTYKNQDSLKNTLYKICFFVIQENQEQCKIKLEEEKEKTKTEIFDKKVYYQFFSGDEVREAKNVFFALDDFKEKKGKEISGVKKKEAFQLKLKTSSESGKINISDITALEIESHDYEQMIKDEGLEYVMPEIAKYVPADDFLVHFETENFVDLKAALEKLVHPVTAEFGLEFADLLKIEELIFQRLGIPENENFYSLISEFAFVSEDLDFFKRTDFAVIVKFKSDAAAFTAKLLENGENAFEQVGDYFVFATDKSILEKIQKTHLGGVENMSSQGDFKYALGVLEKKKDGLVYFSDSFIRKLTSPGYRLNSRRKNTVLTALETLQYTSWAYKDITGKWAKDFNEIEEAGYIGKEKIFEAEKYAIDENGLVWHKDWGSVIQPTPVNRVKIEKITEGEKDLYEAFRERYHSYYTEFFDPIGVAVVVADKISFHTVILPLIENSDYNWLRTFFGEVATKELDFIFKPDRDAAVIAAATFDFDEVLLKMAEEMGGGVDNAKDAMRTSDIMALKMAIEQYYGDNAIYPEKGDFDKLIENRYINEIPQDPETGESYLYDVWDDPKTGVKNQCFRLGAKLMSERSKSRMEDDGGHDANLWETGTCLPNENLPLVDSIEKEEEPEKSEEEIKLEKIIAVEQEIKDELELDDLEFGEGERIFDFMGDEVMLGIGKENEFAENNLANLDVYFGLKLSDPEKAKMLLNQVFEIIAKERRRSGGMGMMMFSSTKPLKNTYNEVEYFMVPTGFINVYYTFLDDRFYLAISQLAMNKIIDGYTKGEVDIASQHERTMDFIGKAKNIMVLADTTAFEAWLGTDIREEVEDEFKYELVSLLRSQVDYIKETMTLRRILDNPNDVSNIYKNIPENFLDMKFEFDGEDVSLNTGAEKIGLYEIDTSRSYYSSINARDSVSTKKTVREILENAELDLSPVFEIFNSLESAGLGFAFTEHGIDVRIAFTNPVETEKDERFSAEEIDEEMNSEITGTVTTGLMQKKYLYSILIMFLVLVIAGVMFTRKK